MSHRVTLDDADMRARLRSPRHVYYTDYRSGIAHKASRTLPASRPLQPAMMAKPKFSSMEFVQPRLPQSTPAVQVPIAATQLSVPAAPQPERPVAQAPSIPVLRQPLREAFPAPATHTKKRFSLALPSRPTLLTAMAVIVFVSGITASFMGFRSNNVAQAQVAQISKKVDSSSSTSTGSIEPAAPSTTPVTVDAVKAYQVAPDLARYIRIPKLGVYARVLQVGVTNTGALATPTNVFDTAWYTGSAKPGQSGATLIDGHVSSWTSHGVFYGIKNLVPGDKIEIGKGDGSKLEYTVIQTVTYDADSVDMQALMQPVMSGKSGLNLITCGGKYDPKSSEFTQRVAVFATLN